MYRARPGSAGQAFRLPAWTPGSYLIREFARHFVDVQAQCAGAPVAVRKASRDVWQVAPCIGSVSLIAEVYVFDLSVRAAYPDQTRGYFNGPSVFVWLVEHDERPCDVEIIAPMSDACHNWRVATSLPRSGAEPYGFGRYAAANYDELIDHPVEMGSFMLAHFEAGGAPVSRVPFDYYLFQVLAAEAARGGLEHRASTSLVCKRDELPQPGARGVSEEYRDLLGLASHEYFLIWNVKRINVDLNLRPREKDKDSFGLTLEAAPQDTCWLALADRADAAAIARRDAWLQAGSAAADATGQPR